MARYILTHVTSKNYLRVEHVYFEVDKFINHKAVGTYESNLTTPLRKEKKVGIHEAQTRHEIEEKRTGPCCYSFNNMPAI